MSRTVAAQDAKNESFAGLLNRLTRHIAPESAVAVTSPRKRPAITVTEVNPGLSKLAPDTVELSYERALRLHTRRSDSRTADAEIDFDTLVAAAPPASPASNPSGLRSSTAKAQPSSVHAQARQPAKAGDTGRSAKKTSPKSAAARVVRKAHTGSNPKVEKKAGTASPAASPAAIPAANSAVNPKRQTQAAQPQQATVSATRPATRPPVRPSVLSNTRPASSNFQHSPSKKLQAAQPPPRESGPAVHTRSNVVQTKKVEPTAGVKAVLLQPPAPGPQLQIERLNPAGHPDHRKSIISMRLNEEEFSRLRNRAAESGISVSAYMRSCVLEAENLRAQVKQALAEMRASTHQPESTQASALSRAVRHGHAGTAETGNRWSRLISYSTTFLLGPWFTARRRA